MSGRACEYQAGGTEQRGDDGELPYSAANIGETGTHDLTLRLADLVQEKTPLARAGITTSGKVPSSRAAWGEISAPASNQHRQSKPATYPLAWSGFEMRRAACSNRCMCSRYSDAQGEKLIRLGEHQLSFCTTPRWVVRPTNTASVVLNEGSELAHVTMRWGFQIPNLGKPLTCARAETVAQKPNWRGSFRARRCLVPACGFYESMQVGGRKLPVRFVPKRDTTLLFAGLWNEFEDVGRAFSIVTCEPNAVVRQYHDRMPVILDTKGAEKWLLGDWGNLAYLMAPCPDDLLTSYPVTPQVFQRDFQSPEALKPVQVVTQSDLL